MNLKKGRSKENASRKEKIANADTLMSTFAIFINHFNPPSLLKGAKNGTNVFPISNNPCYDMTFLFCVYNFRFDVVLVYELFLIYHMCHVLLFKAIVFHSLQLYRQGVKLTFYLISHWLVSSQNLLAKNIFYRPKKTKNKKSCIT